MRNLKKILALVLALMMVLSVMVTASAAFEDADSIQYTQAVDVMAAAGILSGYKAEDGTYTFNPTGTLTRAEAAKLVAYVATEGDLTGIVKCETVFTDVPSTHWASGLINYCYDEGIINGKTETTYAPNGKITVQEYAKLLLGVLGVEGTYTGPNWTKDVRNNATAKGLMAGMTYTWTVDVTREQAAQMTFNAMKVGSKTEVVTTPAAYVVTITDNKGTDADDTDDVVTEYEFATSSDAYFFAATKNAEANPDLTIVTTYVPAGKSTQTTGLMASFGISVTPVANDGADKYGRPALVYTVDNGKDAEGNDIPDTVLAYAEAPVDIYTYELTDDAVAATLKALKAAKYDVEKDIALYVDGELVAEDVVLEDLLKATDNNVVIEIFAGSDKIIDTAVATVTYWDVVVDVTEADEENEVKASIKLDNYGDVETEGYIVDEIVTYTVCDGEIENLAKAEYVVGTVSSYNSKGEYTINGTVYTLYDFELTTEEIVELMSEAHVFYTGANNTIVGILETLPGVEVEEEETPAPVVDGYLKVTDAIVRVAVAPVKELNAWTGAMDIVGYDVSVVALLETLNNEGEVVVYPLTVNCAEKKDLTKGLAKGDYYVEYNGQLLKIFNAASLISGTAYVDADDAALIAKEATDDATEAVSALIGAKNVYAYNTEDGLNLVGQVTSIKWNETKDGIGYRTIAAANKFTSKSLAVAYGDALVLVTDETVVVLKALDNKGTADVNDDELVYVTKTIAELEDTVVDAGLVLVNVDVTTSKDENGDEKVDSRVYYASVIFAADSVVFTPATEEPAEETETHVYISDSAWNVAGLDKNGDPIYTYSAIGTDGSVVTIISDDNSWTEGVYSLDDEGGIYEKESYTEGVVKVVSGTTYVLEGNTVIATDKDTVVSIACEDGALVAGATILYTVDAKTGAFDTIFVIEMPEAE